MTPPPTPTSQTKMWLHAHWASYTERRGGGPSHRRLVPGRSHGDTSSSEDASHHLDDDENIIRHGNSTADMEEPADLRGRRRSLLVLDRISRAHLMNADHLEDVGEDSSLAGAGGPGAGSTRGQPVSQNSLPRLQVRGGRRAVFVGPVSSPPLPPSRPPLVLAPALLPCRSTALSTTRSSRAQSGSCLVPTAPSPCPCVDLCSCCCVVGCTHSPPPPPHTHTLRTAPFPAVLLRNGGVTCPSSRPEQRWHLGL
jgi:hypothetical protein